MQPENLSKNVGLLKAVYAEAWKDSSFFARSRITRQTKDREYLHPPENTRRDKIVKALRG